VETIKHPRLGGGKKKDPPQSAHLATKLQRRSENQVSSYKYFNLKGTRTYYGSKTTNLRRAGKTRPAYTSTTWPMLCTAASGHHSVHHSVRLKAVVATFILNSEVKEDENGADAQKHKGF